MQREEDKKMMVTVSLFCNAMVLMVGLGAIMLLAAFQTNFEVLHLLFILLSGTVVLLLLNIFLSSVLSHTVIYNPNNEKKINLHSLR
jgi:cellulose synthase/poly-beta-1,6-N-acetylglucosamine synthase-like glycosyltransferase